MFAAPPHGDDRVITSFPCSVISPQRSLCPQYDSCIDDDDDVNEGSDDISSSQWSMSPGPPTPRSITSLQGPLSPSHDYNSVNGVNGGCDDCNVTASQLPISSDPPPPLSVATAAQHSSSHETMSSDQSSRKSDDLAGPTCPAPSPYDSKTNDSDEDNDYNSDGFPLSRWTISLNYASRKCDDVVAQGSICPASTPYDSSATDDNTGGDASSQWSMSPGLPSDAISQQQQQQQAYDLTIMAYSDDDYVATAQPSSTG